MAVWPIALLAAFACRAPGDGMIALEGATLIDGSGGEPVQDALVLVKDGKIAAVSRVNEIPVPRGAEVVLLVGKTIIPGLIDSHAHVERWAVPRYLAWGVTTVRDLHGRSDSTLALRQELNLGGVVGPRMFAAGAMIDGSPPTYADATGAATESDARKAVDQRAVAGAELVRRGRSGELDLSRAHLFQLDELLGVGPDDARGFHGFFLEHLVRPLGLGRRFHALDGRARDPAREIERHAGALAELGPADLVVLGLGQNGHVAFNEPGSGLDDPARVVALGARTLEGLRHQFANDGCPTAGLTLGLREIAAGKRVVMLVTGAAKGEMLKSVLRGEENREHPATLLARHPRFVVLADEAAQRGS